MGSDQHGRTGTTPESNTRSSERCQIRSGHSGRRLAALVSPEVDTVGLLDTRYCDGRRPDFTGDGAGQGRIRDVCFPCNSTNAVVFGKRHYPSGHAEKVYGCGRCLLERFREPALTAVICGSAELFRLHGVSFLKSIAVVPKGAAYMQHLSRMGVSG